MFCIRNFLARFDREITLWMIKMKRTIAVFGLLALYGLALALTLDLNIDANAWDGSSRGTSTAPILEPGAPQLPYYPVRVLIPFGEKVSSVEVTLGEAGLRRSGVSLDYARAQQPTSQPRPDATVRDPRIWETNAPYPAKAFDYLGTQTQRGLQFAVINVYPWKYNPVSREIFASETARIRIETAWDDSLARHQANFLAPALTDTGLEDFALNAAALNSYSQAPSYRDHAPQSRLVDLSTPREMIIISNAASSAWLQNYVDWRNAGSVNTAIYLTSDIYSSYPGTDNAEKVRNFISDAYQTWAGTAEPLRYVILGGDDEIVPERGCYGQVGNTVDDRMPVDLYFSNLDGDWNADGDEIWGETLDQVDMLPEVHIGRFPAETQAEFANIIRKTQYYVGSATFSNNIAIMFGENLNNNPLTWGGDYKDDVLTHVPESYQVRTMYQRDGTYSESGVWNAINAGANVMNHMGHANETFLLGQGNNTIEQLANSEYGFLYTQGCYPAAFDQRTSGDGESIAEHMVTTAGGLFAFIGNTRYGWYMPGSINGASQFYDREYFIGLYETVNTQLGAALSYSREQNLNAALSDDVMRWCYYEVVLFGDPSIEVKYPDPALPLLSLESYSISDVEGDNDGVINPGEIIRIYPVIKNHQDWATAYNVIAVLTDLPAGAEFLGPQIVIPQLLPGQTSDPGLYFRVQIPTDAVYGNYTLNLEMQSIHPVTILSTGTRNFALTYNLTLIDDNWDCAVGSKSAPLVHDFDGDSNLDVMYLDVFGENYLLDNSIELVDSFEPSTQMDIMRSSALGDITGDLNPEIVYASRTGKVTAVTPAGTQVFSYDGGSQFLFTPVIADIDGDGFAEAIAHSLDGNIHAIRANGTSLPGFPVDLGPAYQCEIAAVDLDGDGYKDIIAGSTDGNLHAISRYGTELPGFPISVGSPINGAPTVLDDRSIAFGTGSHLYLASAAGSLSFAKPIAAAIASSPALADLDCDGDLEIVFATIGGDVHAVDQTGNDLAGFPVQTGALFYNPPLIANLDADYFPEILLSSYVNSVYAFNHDGSGVAGFPFLTSFNGSTPGTICDLEGDGWLKLVSGYSTGVLVLNLRKPATPQMPWVTFRGTTERTGAWEAIGYVGNPGGDGIPLVTGLEQNYPNPFNPSTTIKYQTAENGRARLAVYNLKGQQVRLLESGVRPAGLHQAVWDGRDDSGNAVSSGVYLYRLQTASTDQVRRMLLVK